MAVSIFGGEEDRTVVAVAQGRTATSDAAYEHFVNPEWVRLLDLLRMNVKYRRCLGTELFTEDGRVILDFLSGYCVHNTGHNHPYIVQSLIEELSASGPVMLQSHVAHSEGLLAERLSGLCGGRLTKVHFCSSGSEGIEAVIKFARAFTGRMGLVYAKGAFPGLTYGALSLMGDPFWKEGFGPMLPETHEVAFGDLATLEEILRTRKIAALVLEPLQGEAGIVTAPAGILPEQSGSVRSTGRFLCWMKCRRGSGERANLLRAS